MSWQKEYENIWFITLYTPNYYWGAQKGSAFFLITSTETGDQTRDSLNVEPLASYADLETKALEILNKESASEDEGIYLPPSAPDRYFTGLATIEGLPGCFSGYRQGKQYILLPRFLAEVDVIDKDLYLPLLFAYPFPSETEWPEVWQTLRTALSGQ